MATFTAPTSNFGDVTVADEQVLTMPKGLIGMPEDRRWVLITREPSSPFLWLQSLDDSDVALPVSRPEIFYPDYQLAVPEHALDDLGLADGHEVEVLCVVRATEAIEDFTINLRGPLLIDPATRVGAQIATLIDYPVAADLWAECTVASIQVAAPDLPIITLDGDR